MIIAGIDEAGYGPLLGPLVVSCSAFDLPNAPFPSEDSAADVRQLPCMWKLLKAAVAKKSPITKGRVIIADSKIVHALEDGKKHLERGVLSVLAAMAQCNHTGAASAASPAISHNVPTNFPPAASAWPCQSALALMAFLGCQTEPMAQHPWYAHHDQPLPWLCDPADLAIAANMLAAAMIATSVHPVCLRTRVVPEKIFNTMCAATNNKASVTVSITLSHLHHLHYAFADRGLVVGIDKQGGRDFYTSILLRTFPDARLKVIAESPQASTYWLSETIGPSAPRGNARLESQPPGHPRQLHTIVHFREKGESHFLPTALASMICKYFREMYMHTYNLWWCRQIEGLKPTAGYHGDGTRWLADVEPHLARIGVNREHIVRIR